MSGQTVGTASPAPVLQAGSRPSTARPPVVRHAAGLVYAVLARHLPWSPRPGGALAKRVRRVVVSRMLDHCGAEVNVEHGASFGSGRGIEVGDRSAIGLDALVLGPLVIGDDVMMGPRCVFVAMNHAHLSTEVPMNRQGFTDPRPIVLEDDVWLGAGVIVLAGVRIGTGSIVGAGAVVTASVPPMSIAAGNPARVLRTRGVTS